MINNFRHRGLKRLFHDDIRRGVPTQQVDRIARILARLAVAKKPADMNVVGYNLHSLVGDYATFWSVRVSKNQRIVFRFADEDVHDVDLVDYH